MKKFLFLICILLCNCSDTSNNTESASMKKDKKPTPAIVIHGGAGTILKKNMTPAKEAAYEAKLQEALEIGYAVLENGGTALEGITAAILVMEDSPLFNAGKGSVFSHNGKNEMDASIMDGATLEAGAVTGVGIIKNPIKAALAVLENSEHVMMAQEGAEAFAQEQGLEIVERDYFFTKKRWDYLQRVLEKEKNNEAATQAEKHGTVGACALDQYGNIAAATSTGGMTNKRFDRIGDSPIIGAGTYADNASCAVSCTGHGEYFIRNVVAYNVAAQMEFGRKDLATAADFIINKRLVQQGGTGGLIAIDAKGNIVMPFNTPGMYRGYKTVEELVVLIYK